MSVEMEKYIKGTDPFNGYVVYTEEGTPVFGFCLRDDTAELTTFNGDWYRVNWREGSIDRMGGPEDDDINIQLHDVRGDV